MYKRGRIPHGPAIVRDSVQAYGCGTGIGWRSALETASKTVEDLIVAELVRQVVTLEEGKITSFRVRLNLSFKYREGI
ncbi:MAG: dodecin family protein [Syntrophales bacterium]